MKPTKMFVFTRQIMENLVSKPVTEEYPFKQSNYTERMRGHIEIDIEQCISCTLCVRFVLLEQFKWTGRREHGALIALIVCNVETVSMSVLKSVCI